MEQCYIALYDTTNPNKGYNITIGGESANGYKPTEEQRKKQSECMSGENNPNYRKNFSEKTREKMSKAKKGKPLSEEHRQRISEVNKGEKNSMYGKTHTKETKRKMSENHADFSGANNGRAEMVICLESGEIFDTIIDAFKSVSGTRQGLFYAMKENRKYKGYTFMYYKDYLEEVG